MSSWQPATLANSPGSASAAPGQAIMSSSSPAARLNRRWSLDNISENLPQAASVEGYSVVGGGGSKEGYVRDLRRQHQMSLSSMRDEEYPYMITEHQRSGNGCPGAASASTSGKATPPSFQQAQQQSQQQLSSPKLRQRLLNTNRTRSGSMDLGKYPRTRPVLSGLTACARPGSNYSFSSSVDISVVPEDTEVENPSVVVEPMAPSHQLAGSPSSSSSTPTRSPSPSHSSSSSSSLTQHASARSGKFLSCSAKMSGLEGKTKAFLRQRSSSLPRILPPILDAEDSSAAAGSPVDSNSVQDRQSNVVVREMQKFICRQATDVSDLLPLPIPTNSRQGKSLRLESERAASAVASSWANGNRDAAYSSGWKAHSMLVIKMLAKIHGIMFAIKQSSPNLYSEFITTLNVRDRPVISDEDVARIQCCLRDNNIKLLNDGDDDFSRCLQTLASSLALPFSIIVHGDVDLEKIVFRYLDNDTTNEAPMPVREDDHIHKRLKLPGLNRAFVGSPLMDLFQYVHASLVDGGAKSREKCAAAVAPPTALVEALPELLGHYHDHFDQTCRSLRISSQPLSRVLLQEDFLRYLRAGLVLVNYRQQRCRQQTTTANQSSAALSDACLDLLRSDNILATVRDTLGNGHN